jgi:hypothetical protein
VQTKEKYKLKHITKAYKLSHNYLKLHHKSTWQIVGQGTSQAPVFWRLKEMEVKLLALSTGRALLPRNIIFLLLVFISVRG